jgi:hypothetical protein
VLTRGRDSGEMRTRTARLTSGTTNMAELRSTTNGAGIWVSSIQTQVNRRRGQRKNSEWNHTCGT